LNDAAGTMTVEFPVTEGPQTLVTSVRREGIDEEHLRELPEPQLAAGAPLNPQLLHEDRIALQSYFANTGHTEVQVSPRVEISEDKTAAAVTYVVAEGPHVHVDEVIVRGNTYTDRDVILRRSNLDPGDPFSYTGMLEAQQELYRLGIFQRVEIEPERAGTTVADRDVVIQVEEGKNLTLTGSIGLRLERAQEDVTSNAETPPDEEPPTEATSGNDGGTDIHERVTVAVAHRNLFGTGRYLGLEIVAGREEQEAFLTYREPFISRWDVPLQLQIFQSDDSTRPGTTILQRGLSIEASKIARLRTRWSLRYEYKISECEGDELCEKLRNNEPVETLDPSVRTIQISSITPTFFWDTRDDIIDPHRGFFTSASVEYAFPTFSADAHFLKEYVQGAWYLPLSRRTVLALAGRAGLIQNYGRRIDDTGMEVELPVPLSERFTAGGENTHRAFPLDRLGNLCTDPEELKFDCQPTLFRATENSRVLPLGGNALFLVNAEYRFPIFSSVGGAVFADIGNVFAKTINFDQLRYGAGLGIRYLSPVGPVRVDVAMPLRRYESYERDAFQYFISLGYAF
jgi:outer membrane protein insertion porin family